MKICPNCGASNPDNRIKCEYCKSYIGKEEIGIDTSIDDIKSAVKDKEEKVKEIADKLDEVFKAINMAEEGSVLSNELRKYRDKLQSEYLSLTGHIYFYECPDTTSTKSKVVTIILVWVFLIGITVLAILSNMAMRGSFR